MKIQIGCEEEERNVMAQHVHGQGAISEAVALWKETNKEEWARVSSEHFRGRK